MTGSSQLRAVTGRKGLILVAAILLLVVMALSVVAALRYLRVDEIELPDLRGMPYEQAAELLRQEDLVPRSYAENLPGAPVESVTSQTPPAGAVVRRGRTVSIGVNRPPEAAQAPVLVGLTQEQAGNTVRAVGLELGTVEFVYSDQPVGRVVEQRPAAGELVSPDEGVAIVVSRGPDQNKVEMPDLTGLELEEARTVLSRLGLRSVELVASAVSFSSPGTVATQVPAAGDEVLPGTPVILGYRLSAREVVPVPDLVGQSASVAGRALQAAGLKLGEIQYVDDPERPAGTVVSVKPASYTLRGAPVALSVNAAEGSFDRLERELAEMPGGDAEDTTFDSDGPVLFENDPSTAGQSGDRTSSGDDESSEGGRRVTVTFDPASLGVRSLVERDYELRLVVQDDQGERTVIDRQVRAGETVSAVVVVHGDALLQTYINGVFFQAWRP